MHQGNSMSIELRPMTVLLKVLQWARKYWISYVFLSIIIFLSALLPVGTAEGMRRLIDAVFNRSLPQLWEAAGVLVVVPIAGLVLSFAQTWLMQRLSNRSILDLQREVLGRLFLTDLLRLGKSHTGDKVQRLNESAVKAQDGINKRIPQMIEQLLSIVFLFIYLTVLSWALLFGALTISFVVPMISNLMAKPIRKWQQKKINLKVFRIPVYKTKYRERK